MLIDLMPPVAGAAATGELASQLRLPAAYAAEPEGAARLGQLATAAIRLVEARTGRALVRRHFLLRLAAWPDGGRLRLRMAPVTALEALVLEDEAGQRQPADAGLLRLDALGAFAPAVVARAPHRLPPIPPRGVAELAFEAGHGPLWSDVPADLRLAVMLLGAALHDADAATDAAAVLPGAVRALTDPYREARL